MTETVPGIGAVPGSLMYILRRNVEGGPRIADDFATDAAREVFGVHGEINDAWIVRRRLRSTARSDSQNGNL